jgi:uncharacterized membrane protein
MDPILRIVLALIGSGLGAAFSSPSDRGFGALLGAIAMVGIAELYVVLSKVKTLEQDLDALRREVHRMAEARTVPAQPVAPTPRPDIPVTMPWRDLEQDKQQTPAPSEKPSEHAAPSGASRPLKVSSEPPIIGWIRGFFTGGNALVRAGVVILFFGVAFLLRYMAEHTHVPIELRLSGIAVGGIVLLIFGWRLRTSRAGYALALQGGAIGILYLTVFAALRLYGLLPASIAFPILAAIAIFSAMLAVLQNSMSFALLAVTGGFLAPVLASTGEGSHVVLFSYYALLNAGILGMAWFKAWRPLNIAGFVFTFAIGTAWGVLRYRPETFGSTEPFLVLFFLFYLAIAILYTFRQPVELTGYIDGTLIFGTPIVVFALQSVMLHEHQMNLAYSAVAMSALYLSIAWLLRRRLDESQTLLIEAFIAIGVVFLTLAIPLALDARWNAAAWALEGAALIWVGCRQSRALPRNFGAVLIFASGCIVAGQFDVTTGHVALPLASYFGVIILSTAAICAAHILNTYKERLEAFEHWLPGAVFTWGLWWWSIGGLCEVDRYWPAQFLAGSLLFATLTTLASSVLHRLTQLHAARIAALLQLPAMLVIASFAMIEVSHPFVNGGWLAWPLAFIGVYYLMYRHEGAPREPLANLLNTGAGWLLCAIFSWEAAWEIRKAIPRNDSWRDAAWAAIPALLLFLLPRLVTRVKWPFARNRDAYLFIAGVGLAVFLGIWSLVSNLGWTGDSAPLPYFPFLNPLDLAQAFVFLILLRYWRFLRAVGSPGFARLDRRLPMPVLSALGFIWLNAVLVRTLHQWFGIAYRFDDIMASTLVQTSLSIFWAILALLTMLIAARRGRRVMWMVGAGLIAVVIVKLFLVDLSRIGSIERIVSFVGVGLLMLIVGYVSPLPPAEEAS